MTNTNARATSSDSDFYCSTLKRCSCSCESSRAFSFSSVSSQRLIALSLFNNCFQRSFLLHWRFENFRFLGSCKRYRYAAALPKQKSLAKTSISLKQTLKTLSAKCPQEIPRLAQRLGKVLLMKKLLVVGIACSTNLIKEVTQLLLDE